MAKQPPPLTLIEQLQDAHKRSAYFRNGLAPLLAAAIEALIDTDHAVALEREATIALLEKYATRKVDLAEELKSVGERGEATRCYGEAGTLSHAAQMIRTGTHHASTPPSAQERGQGAR